MISVSTGMTSDKRMLCVGLNCFDMITVCHEFPQEDSDQRVKDYYLQRGGNASNSASVLALMGASTEFLGTMARSHELRFLQNDMEEYGISSENCLIYGPEYSSPISIVMISANTGSRTILHSNKNLPELKADYFTKLNLKAYSWIHFEGRPSCEEIEKMLVWIEDYNRTASTADRVVTSVEAEKPCRPQHDLIINHSDFVFISKDYAKDKGYENKETAVKQMTKYVRPGATVICAWGEDGAAAQTWDGQIFSSPSFPPVKVVDTLAAGDTFNAACIYALSKGRPVHDAITLGCKLAGAKCGMTRLKELKTVLASDLKNDL